MKSRSGWRRLALEVPARDAEPACALLSAITGERVATEHKEGLRVVVASAYTRESNGTAALREMRARLRALQLDGMLRTAVVTHANIRDDDWSQSWKRYHHPSRIARGLYLVPSWERSFFPPGSAQSLILDPGMAFGTGQHATTRLALRLMLARVAKGDVVIDAGCGSGILGIAAALRGAIVYAFDNDPIAVRTARENFERNAAPAAAIVEADRIPASFPAAQMIAANINGEAFQRRAPQFAGALAEDGSLVSSGITARSRLATLFHFAHAGLAFVEERHSGEWFAHVHTRDQDRGTAPARSRRV